MITFYQQVLEFKLKKNFDEPFFYILNNYRYTDKIKLKAIFLNNLFINFF